MGKGIDCPEPEDRFVVMRDWSCEDYDSYRTLASVFIINVFIVKIIQVICFSYLTVKLAI